MVASSNQLCTAASIESQSPASIHFLVTLITFLPLINYNSALFSVVSRQDYNITILKSMEEPAVNDTSWKSMTNAEWIKVYSDNYISGYRDILLIVQDAASSIVMKAKWTFVLTAIGDDSCRSSSSPAFSRTPFEYLFYLNFTHMAVTQQTSEPSRYV